MKLTIIFAAIALFLTANSILRADTFGSGANTFDIEFVTIGNPNNPDDNTGRPNPAGSVPYNYRIGKYEISEQMIEKANALGGLEITKVEFQARNTIDDRGPNKPVTSITWNQAARFVNWLNISSGNTPAYKFALQPGDVGYKYLIHIELGYSTNHNIELWTPDDAGYNPNNPYRNSQAKYFLPSVDEWYKAAYFDPSNGVYYDYATGSDGVPDGIDFLGDTNFDAVFFDGDPPNSQPNYEPNDITDVGVLSPYGTAGQSGNVTEWQETDFDLVNGPINSLANRGGRGGHWYTDDPEDISALYWWSNEASNWHDILGFRVASVIPEPSTGLLLISLGVSGLLGRRR